VSGLSSRVEKWRRSGLGKCDGGEVKAADRAPSKRESINNEYWASDNKNDKNGMGCNLLSNRM
jgi:hypothetical protein